MSDEGAGRGNPSRQLAGGPIASDREAGFEVTSEFERFNQKHDVFRRSWWDERIRSERSELFCKTYREPLESWRKADGFTQKDYALRNAAGR